MAPLKSFLLVSSGLASAQETLACANENCEAGDQTALLQSHLSRKSDLSLTSTGAAFFPKLANLNDPHTRKSALLEIQKTAMKLASTQGPVEDVVVEICLSTANMLNETVLMAIIEEDAVDRAALQTAYDDFAQHEERRQAAQDAIDAAEAAVAHAATALTACRTLEEERCVGVEECEEIETHGPCNEYEECWNCNHCTEMGIMDGTATLCCIDQAIHHRWCEGEGAEATVRQDTEWRQVTSNLFNHYNTKEVECTSHHEICINTTTHCETVMTSWYDTRTDCHTKMSLWQDQSCQYHHTVSGALELYQQGFLQTLEVYNDVVARVMIEEADRKVEWEVLTRVICLLLSLTVGQGEAGAVSAEDNQARIQLCWDQEVDTSHLDIEYLPPPDMLGLPVLPPWPCDADYLHSDPIFSPPAACTALIATHGSLAETACVCTANNISEPDFSLGHYLMVDPAIQVTVSNAQTTWSTTLSDGTVFSGAMSQIHREPMPALTDAFFTEDEMEESDVAIAGVAWAYGSPEHSSGASTLEQRFAANGGLLFVNQNDEVVQVRQLAPSSTSLNQDVAAYLSFAPQQELSVEQFAAGCPTPQDVTDSWHSSLGARQYCWIKSGGDIQGGNGGLAMCNDGCFAYKMADDSRIVFPLVEGAFMSSLSQR